MDTRYPLNYRTPSEASCAIRDKDLLMTSTPPAVRILPMSETDPEFHGWTTQRVQEEFFLDRLPVRGGSYLFPTSAMIAAEGTMVLFQYKKHAIACGVLLDVERFAVPKIEDGASYQGAYHFAPMSIRVFEPVDAERLRDFWPTFRQFSQSKQVLTPPEAYLAFERSLVGVRSTLTSLNDDDASEKELDEYVPTGEDRREVVLSQIRARRGQHSFRELLRKQYGDRCVITGCRTPGVLEAAHISPYLGEKDNDATNGLLLRADVHTLFDLHLLGIEPQEQRVEVHPKIAEDYGFLSGRTLDCTMVQPSHAALEERYKLFQTRLKSD